ncbi:unnamed protein product [Caenorhabditis brenneri]
MSQSTSKLKNNGLEVVYVPVEEIEKTEKGYTITCPDGTKLSSRSDFLVPKINLEGNKKFYIPYHTLLDEGVETKRVQVCDVAIVLKNMPMLLLDSRKYRTREWVSSYAKLMGGFEKISYATILLEEMEILLDTLEVDRKMITVVNDPGYTFGVRDLLRRGTGSVFVKRDPGEDKMFTAHAIFYIFHSIVTKVNFRMELCEEHEGCIENFRMAVIAVCEVLAESERDQIISKKTVQALMIRDLTKHCSFSHHLKRPKEKRIGFLNSNSSDRFVPTQQYEDTVKYYGLPDLGKFCKTRSTHMKSTVMRFQLMLGWIYSVYGKEWPKSKSYVLDVMLNLCEEEYKLKLRDELREVLDYDDMPLLLGNASEEVNQIEKMDEVENRVVVNLGELSNHWSSKLHVYSFFFHRDPFSNELEAEYPMLGVLLSNYKLLNKNETIGFKPTHFLVERQYALERTKRQGNTCLRSFTDFHEVGSTIYIRSFGLKIAGVKSVRLLTDDVMELAELLLKQKDYDELVIKEQLRECRHWWGEENTTIPLHSFQRFLDDCAIYQADIRIVEDMAYTASVERYRKRLTPISFPNHFNEEVMFASHAALHVFDSVVFNANWKIERCKEHEKCLTDYRQKIIETVQKYESNKLILRKDVEDDISTLQSHCSYRKLLGWVVLFLETSGVVVKLLDAIALTLTEKPKESIDELWLKLVEDESFVSLYYFDPEPEEEQDEEGEGSSSPELTTSEVVKEQGPVRQDGDETSPSPASPESTANERVEVQEPGDNHDNEQMIVDNEDSEPVEVPTSSPSMNDNAPTSAPPSASGSSSQNVVLVAEETREPRRADKPKISTKKPKPVLPIKSPEELALEKAKKRNDYLEIEMQKVREEMQKLHEKMDNANDVLKNMREAKEKAEQKANHYESLAKTSESRGQRLNEREKELKQKNKEIEKLKKQLDSQQERLLKAEEIEKKAKDRKKIEEDLRKSNKNLQVQVSTLEKKVADASENLEAEKEKHDTKQKNMAEEVDKLKSENQNLCSQIRIKEQENAQLKCDADKKYMKFLDINSRLKCEKDHQTQTINELKEQVRKLSNCLSSRASVTPSPSTSTPGPSRDLPTSLEALKNIRDNFEEAKKEQIMQNGREMVVELLHLKNDEETQKFAEAELKNLEKSVEDYLEILTLNIQIFKMTNDASKLLSHSELPKLSQNFMELYSRLESQQSGIPDSDCVICHLFRDANEETITCHRCQKIYHATCLREWYKQPASCEKCPTCKVVLRDPDEYPVLA